jgi:predicted component of type VI protein secretion system
MEERLMRLTVKKDGNQIGDFDFAKGPIHIGRHTDSHIFLSDRSVSRHHAIIFNTEDGKWLIEDLNSANKTYLNDKQIQKEEVVNGSVIKVGDFILEVSIEEKSEAVQAATLEDTLSKTAYNEDALIEKAGQFQVIVRRTDFEHAPDMRLPAKRVKDFIKAAEAICKANNHDDLISALLDVANSQFSAFHSWVALRNVPAGSMTAHGGRQRDGSRMQFSEVACNDKITEAIEKKQFMLLPRMPVEIRDKQKINSAMVGPIICKDGCFGVVYVDNDMSHEHYSLSDLDYLMLISIHTAAILRNF